MPLPFSPASVRDPVRVPDSTPVCDRVGLLNGIADAGTRYGSAVSLAWRMADAVGHVPSERRAEVLADLGLRAVQSLPYVPDPEGQEWVQGVDYTFAHGGDCKDLSAALAAVYRTLGLRAEVYWITQTGRPLNHVTVRVFLGGQWRWAEPSIRGARLGESPYDALRRMGHGTSTRGVTL